MKNRQIKKIVVKQNLASIQAEVKSHEKKDKYLRVKLVSKFNRLSKRWKKQRL